MSEEACIFAVLASWGGTEMLELVPAYDPLAAIELFVEKMRENKWIPYGPLSFKTFVLGPEQLRAVTPEIKDVARTYWRAARESVSARLEEIQDDGEFESTWLQEGPTPTKADE